MGKTKTIEDYEELMRKAHSKGEEPTYSQLSSWASLVPLTIFQSQQEWYPWTAEELGYPVLPMAKKRDTKKEHVPAQTGDYIAFYKTPSGEGWIPFVIERKGGKEGKSGPHDLYGTTSNKENRTNLYEEVDRFIADNRFEKMFLIAECTYKEYLEYIPLFSGRDDKGRPKRNVHHVGLSVETREATIAGLYLRGCTVIFAGTRAKAIKMYKDLMRLWLMKNWRKVLFSESKLIGEDKNSLSFEVSGMKFVVPKDAIKVIA